MCFMQNRKKKNNNNKKPKILHSSDGHQWVHFGLRVCSENNQGTFSVAAFNYHSWDRRGKGTR